MLVEQAVCLLDIGSTSTDGLSSKSFMSSITLLTTATRTESKKVPRGPRRKTKVTWTTSPSLNFDSLKLRTAASSIRSQETPSLGVVVENSGENLEDRAIFGEVHGPSTSVALRGECLGHRSQITEEDVIHNPPLFEETPTPPRTLPPPIAEPTSCPLEARMLHQEPDSWSEVGTRRDATDTGEENCLLPIRNHEFYWDAELDNEILRQFYRHRLNLVLDSLIPSHAPHIVITPPEENVDDYYIHWQNRLDWQYPGSLIVPEKDVATGRLLCPEVALEPVLGIPIPILSLDTPPHVDKAGLGIFSASKFKQFIDSTSDERLCLTQVVKIFQKVQCKAVFFVASNIARSFRKRYDSAPSILSNIDSIFTWTDPAEPLLHEKHRSFGTTILDTVCPFLTPHIIITAPPPQLPETIEHNFAPYIQDVAFGQNLIVPSSFCVQYINVPEGWDSCKLYSHTLPSDDVNQLQSELPSRTGTPTPDTPVDECNDIFFARDEICHAQESLGSGSDFTSIYGFDSHTEAECVANCHTTLPHIFFIDEDEDDLPSLDDWH